MRDKIKRAWRDGWYFVLNDEFLQMRDTTEADFIALMLPRQMDGSVDKEMTFVWRRRPSPVEHLEGQ